MRVEQGSSLERLQHTGSYTDILTGTMPLTVGAAKEGTSFLLKKYGGKDGGLPYEDVAELWHNVEQFGEIAHKLGIRVSKSLGHYTQLDGGPGKYYVVDAVPRLGADLRAIMEEKSVDTDQALGFIDQYLDMHRRTWQADFPISLDPPLANYCVDKDGQLTFIDPMPPRRKLNNGAFITEWPTPAIETQPFHNARHFSAEQAKVIYGQIMRLAITRGIPANVIREKMGKTLGEEAYRRITTPEEVIVKISNDPRPTDIDTVRVLAFDAHERGNLAAENIKKVYELTHIDPGGILPQVEDVKSAVKLIGLSQPLRERVVNAAPETVIWQKNS